MNRRDLAKTLATTFDPPLSFRDADATMKGIFEAIAQELVAGGEVAIPGLGRWKVRPTAAGRRRNPQTGAMIQVAASQKVRFSPASALKVAVADTRPRRGSRRAPARSGR